MREMNQKITLTGSEKKFATKFPIEFKDDFLQKFCNVNDS